MQAFKLALEAWLIAMVKGIVMALKQKPPQLNLLPQLPHSTQS